MSKTVIAAALLSLMASASFAQQGASAAAGSWKQNHPRRAEVNARLNHQHARIQQQVQSGTLTATQGAALHKEDRQIRQEERDMASQNGGHITATEQKTLNQQENAVSKQIGK